MRRGLSDSTCGRALLDTSPCSEVSEGWMRDAESLFLVYKRCLKVGISVYKVYLWEGSRQIILAVYLPLLER